MTKSSELLSVRIDGHDYRVRLGGQDPAHIERLAAHVDLRIAELRKATGLGDLRKLLILVCLNLADEVYLAQSATAPPALDAEPAADTGQPKADEVLRLLKILIDSKGTVAPPWPRK